MKKHIIHITSILLFILSQAATGSSFASNETQAVKAAVDNFYLALNSMFIGDVQPMEQIWSHKDDVTYMGPAGGLHVGWQQVLADWEQQAKLKLGGKVEPKDMQITVGRDLAIISNYEVGENTGPDGKIEDVTIRATNLFRMEDGAWKMIGHHTDLLPFLNE
ncbi:MAG: nuclear transport factor 2 family protein [Gammaproteobacteria bacterium]|nr:nuclear transport factor 2 family protein [Gammaproteobacteria bacterium]MCP4088716.1 nuclear transport factor 2 family protein [Gammaproteobacteria bacterium]MCP4275241.1 nuclear transport factor 2 family protein [Gammaproteobacteria bacterium]MCP4830749.1 nuclear transport factor 2 family protein [Gammaproteobacteria bacterium]MCP4929538.1 nuclear transport factor 2 family protein [Gammaproteobacteria bacterium]